MDFWEKNDAALKLLAQCGLARSEYAPPVYRLLWKWRVPVRPPHFQSFRTKAFLMGGSFGLIFGTLMWLAPWTRPMSLTLGILQALIAGTVCGLAMATILQRGWHTRRLPRWDSIGSQVDS